ncbi:hypothetical protein E7W39_04735 [Cronobacter sakazakii]|uniref:DUF6707 family protein n=4 Tax=Cronobacter sakazakii TaxID=28141 RepID=UPI00084E0C74|nr:DUF6707 family protein [Cronobacter sakazakii]EGT4511167.1 hypothetical protein [Cronobacter sakazakii]EJG0604952.1 hypothetical protein [Cronobacter sakazakii]EJG0613531.1 hypothetical protein [Cronobacter sakazakii]EJG0617801.1 hypothetical protein [Cronobacter sakazakii]EJG0627143.1 hypothetical protein [Cronobacter sakazakii]
MSLKNILSELSEESVAIKNAISLLSSKSIKTDKAIVETLTKLAYFFFIDEKEQEAMAVCDQLANIQFNNDYDYWTWVEYALCLRIELSSRLGDPEKKEISISVIKKALDSGEGLVKKIRNQVHERFMNGEEFGIDEVESKDSDAEFEARMIYLMKLFKAKAFGGSEFFNPNFVDAEVKNTLKILQALLIDVDKNQLAPFK